MNGPTFPISLQGSGEEPKVVFSVPEVNFGRCFLHRPEMNPATATVIISNQDEGDVRYIILNYNNYTMIVGGKGLHV